jgi:hypothetical protein
VQEPVEDPFREIDDAIELAVPSYPLCGAVVGILTHKIFEEGASRFDIAKRDLITVLYRLFG